MGPREITPPLYIALVHRNLFVLAELHQADAIGVEYISNLLIDLIQK